LAKPFMDTGNTRLRIKKDRLEKRHRAFFITPSLYFGGYEFVVRFCLGQQIMRLICIKSERIYVPLRNWVENKPYSHLMIKPFIVNNILTENSDRTLSNPKTMKSTCQSPLPSWSQTASLSPDGSIDAADCSSRRCRTATVDGRLPDLRGCRFQRAIWQVGLNPISYELAVSSRTDRRRSFRIPSFFMR